MTEERLAPHEPQLNGVVLLFFAALSAAAAAAADCATSTLMRVSSRKVRSSLTFSMRPGMSDASACGGPVCGGNDGVSACVWMEVWMDGGGGRNNKMRAIAA